MAKVEETMTRDFVLVPPSASIIEVAQKMRDCGTSFIPVCENGKFRGVVSEKDIITHIVATAHNPKRERAKSLINNKEPMVSPGEDLIQAAKIMASNGVRVLPVAQNGRLLGFLTLDDLARESLALAATVLAKTAKEKPKETR